MSAKEYQNILDLQEIISQKEEELKQYEDNLQQESFGILGGASKVVDPHSELQKIDHQQDIAELSQYIDQYENMQSH